MVELSIQDVPMFKLETIEIDQGGTSYTFDTMELLRKREPLTDFYFIIGGDQVEDLPKWYRIEELIQNVHLVGVPRPNKSLETAYPIVTIEIPQIDLSSTTVRNRIINGETTQVPYK